MLNARVVLHPEFRIGSIDRRLFGSLLEHMGRAIYGGIFEPGHPNAEPAGLRQDVLAAVRDLGVSTVRYPGGNFVSGYRWEDGIGPRDARPSRLDPAWRQIEDNSFGLDEFAEWAHRADIKPILALNLGTRGMQEACDLLEYANHPGGTYWSERRIANGHREPHNIRMWCLGNEVDAPWQMGHKTAREYGRLAAETARAMRMIDPDVELIASGSSSPSMPTVGRWEATVLDCCYDLVDYLSLHAYYEPPPDGDVATYLASGAAMDAFIDAAIATCDHVGAVLGSAKPMMLAFDEWNVWYQSTFSGRSRSAWERAPRLLEYQYTQLDAIVVGGLLMSLLRHCDRVRIACLAQLVNVIAPITVEPTGPLVRHTIFHPFALTARYARGDVLRTEVRGATIPTDAYGSVTALDLVATHDQVSGDLTLLMLNRSPEECLHITADLGPFGSRYRVAAMHCLTATGDGGEGSTDPHAGGPMQREGQLTLAVPPASWVVLALTPHSEVPVGEAPA